MQRGWLRTDRAMTRRWRKLLSPAQGALHTSADAEEDAVVCLAPWLLFSCCPVVFHFFLKMSKDPLVFSEKIKSVLYTHSLSFIKINQQINLDFFPIF